MDTEKEFHRYSISTRDFEKALQFAQAAQNYLPNNIVYEALLFSAIVSFCRPGSNNETDKESAVAKRLSIKDFETLTTEERELHDQCVKWRNQALAHSQSTLNQTTLKESGVIDSNPFYLLNQNINLGSFISLIGKCLDVCHRKRGDYVRHV